MRIEQLEYLVEVAETKSLTQAAKTLYISQPSLSNAMKELEREMEITLFNRSQKGITLTADGEEFLSYAQQVLEQVDLMKRRYQQKEKPRQIFSVAGQHYAFVVDAFVRLLKEIDQQDYQATLKESRTFEVIEDVANLKSEIGVIYRSNYNRQVINSTLKDRRLTFTPLHVAKPHVFIYQNHPLASKDILTLEDLEPYPKLSYEQGHHNSFYFWEEVLADHQASKSIIVSDRATLFNLLIGLNGYTISSGIINSDLNGEDIVGKKLVSDEQIELGYITSDFHQLNHIATRYLDILEQCAKGIKTF
ncbi:MAG: LysR family transcriptional regulator [Bavariicoccus seileri]|uniref:LysR family transcriptional regulator n=1 Tax=Bavariicoccus seileri TaxID=549685 RepID=UPI0003B408CD|nr:LysR family transcriptional regulator [Bavariicoccus seileri]